jgi:ribonuclease G
LLPGESLKKYGGGTVAPEPTPRASAPRSANTTALPRPTTLVNDPSAFALTGSGVLAGETLRKYRERPAESAPARQEERPSRPAAVESEAPEHGAPEAASAPVVVPSIAEREERHEQRAHTPESTHEFSGDFTGDEPESGVEAVSPMEPEPPQTAGHERFGFSPGSGEVEEELIDEEEQEFAHYGESLEEGDLEELEEETLEMDEAATHEDEMIAAGEKIAAAFAEARRPDAATPTFEEEEEDEEFGEEDGTEVAEDEAELEESEEPAEVEEGRAEVRASSGTAGFQQRGERDRTGRDRGRRGGRRGRPSGRPPMRSRRNIPRGPLPQINELLKEGQEILVQIAKEPMAKKGARITSHIALPGRFLVFMPTVNHTGVSRKIGSDEERRRLKHILLSEKGDAHGGFIVRTAAAGASEEELRSDIRFLINLWNEIKQRSEASKAPALIYHDLNLVERILRDQVTANFTSIWVDSEAEYERILRFAQRFQPSLIKRVKLYSKDTPLFEQFGVQDEINKALKSKVWLKSGGYIVINQTEALVAIDINTGKFVGKTSRLEDTIVKTNIDAIQEIVRQIRLRDLGGIIIIDFIDMDERRNRQKVMQALEEALRADRSPTKVLQFNDFGLVAITRKRVKQSLERTLSTQCGYCTGTGMVKSVPTICNEIYVELRKMHKQLEGHQVMLRVNPEVAKGLKENSGRWLSEMEELIGKTIIVKSDPAQHQEQFDIQ